MEKIKEKLRVIVAAINTALESGMVTGRIVPEVESIPTCKVQSFEYEDGFGIKSKSAVRDFKERKTWYRASVVVQEELKELEEVKQLPDLLEKILPQLEDAQIRNYIDRFVMMVTNFYLENSRALNAQEVDSYIDKFLSDVADGPVIYKATVRLTGVVVPEGGVELTPGYTLRRPNLEEINFWYDVEQGPLTQTEDPTAVLEIVCQESKSGKNIIQRKVLQAVAFLRLYDVGSVKALTYKITSDSFLTPFNDAVFWGNGDGVAYEKYQLTAADVEAIQSYWERVSPRISSDIYLGTATPEHVEIAYKHYENALLQSGTREARITNAVTALEALYSFGDHELKYRLSLNVGKFLSKLGYSGQRVRMIVGDSYAIRSAFAHGSILSAEKKKKLEKKYGDIEKLLRELSDIVRFSILIFATGNFTKDSILRMCDEAILDLDADKAFENELTGKLPLV